MDKILTLLGFASKAGKLSFGMDASCTAIKKKQAQLIVTASDVSEKSRKEITFAASKTGVSVITLNNCDMEKLSHAVGRKGGIISVNEVGFAQSITKQIGLTGGNADDK